MTATPSPTPPPLLPPASGTLHWSPRPFRLLLALVLVLPGLLFGMLAWNEYREVWREGEQLARRTTTALTEHALKVLDTHDLVLELVDAQIRGHSWEEIERDARLRASLAAIPKKFLPIHSIWLVDATGRVRHQSGPPSSGQGLSVAHRDYFLAHRDGPPRRLFISEPFDGRLTGKRLFTVSIRRTTPDGRFDGLISVAVEIGYFTRFWEQFVPATTHVIPLMRADGTLLVRHPVGEHPPRLSLAGPYLRQIAASPAGGFYVARSAVDGIERMNAYSRIGGYPLSSTCVAA